MDWEAERANYLEAMVKILQTEIRRLWDPPVVEEEFVKWGIDISFIMQMLMETTPITMVTLILY